MDSVDWKMVFSSCSFLVTMYFWLIKARKERPHLELFQLANFRVTSRKNRDQPGRKTLYVQQLDRGGVLIVNHSTRQNSVVLFECYLHTDKGVVPGDWGYGGDDRPPWNVGPESTIAFSPACIFDVPEEYEPPDDLSIEIRLITASGTRFSHTLKKEAPRSLSTTGDTARAA